MLGHDLSEVAVREGLAKVRWPGRFEIVQNLAGVPVVLDGAHTAAAARVLAQTYSAEFPGVKPVVLLGLLRDKDPLAIACALAPIAQRLVAVTPPGPRGLPAAELAQSVEPLDIEIETIDEIGVALTAAKGAPLLVSGSLTTVAAAREALGLGVPDPSFPE
jgi:dihydrofolate synthase/folylpolyglutamate synthase